MITLFYSYYQFNLILVTFKKINYFSRNMSHKICEDACASSTIWAMLCHEHCKIVRYQDFVHTHANYIFLKQSYKQGI